MSADSPGSPTPAVAFLTQRLTAGGAERQLLRLAEGLAARGTRVTVIAFRGEAAAAEALTARGVAVRLMGQRRRRDLPRTVARIAGALRVDRPQVLHSYLPVANVLGVLFKALVPGLRLVWGVRSAAMPLDAYDRLSRLSYRLESWLADRADRVIVNSEAGARDLIDRRGFPAGRVAVVRNGIDTDRFAPDPAAGRALRRQLGVPEAAPLIALVGRVDPVKDHAGFLEAGVRMRAARPDLHLLCVGRGPADAEAELAERAAALGLDDRLHWLDWQDEMAAVYSAATVLCSTSLSEGFSNVIAEAMACGTPAAVTDVGDSSAIVDDLGRTVAPGDPAAMAAAALALLERVADDPEGTMVACRARIAARFSIDRLVAETEAVLRAVDDPRPASGA